MTVVPERRGRGRGDQVMRSAARGAALVGVAIVVGIILLNVVDRGSPGSGGSGAAATAATSTTTVAGSTGTTVAGGTTLTTTGRTTTTKKGAARSPAEVRVFVRNGAEVNQAATNKANELRNAGYVISGTDNAPTQTGTTVQCRDGFSKEATDLAAKITGATVKAGAPNPLPADTDCVVILGK